MDKYKELKNKLIQSNNSYYKDNKSEMTDYEFDMKLKELEEMEKAQGFTDPDSPTQKPGSDLKGDVIQSNAHRRPMLSLENTYNNNDVEKWYNDMKVANDGKDVNVVIQPKFDGGSAAITFKDGKVIKALTRGDGLVGEDITQNVKLLDWSKIKKSFTGEVRGELIITKEGFKKLNKDGKYQNARNLLSGSMKLLDPNEFKKRSKYIKFYAYWYEDSKNSLYSEDMTEINIENGFDGAEVTANAKSLEDILKALDVFESMKNSFSYEIDGAVIKVNDKKLWEKTGSTAKFPRWAKAFKFKQSTASSIVRNITFEVGRTGKITPLAWFDNIFIDGSTIQKATLNNKEFYDSMDIAVGDTVIVQKAAAIIPQIIKVIKSKNRLKIQFPKVCPSCSSKLEKHNIEHSDLYCNNPKCKARVIDGIVNYTHSLEIDGFAEIIVERLYDAGYLKSIEDLYKLKNHKEEIGSLDRLSVNIANKLVTNIEAGKSRPLWKLIAGLGIPNVGPKLSKVLAEKFESLTNLSKATCSDLENIPDIATITADGIFQWLNNEDNKSLIQSLISNGQNTIDISKDSNSKKLDGKVFCITGSLSIPRNKFIEIIEKNGGKITNSVSGKTSYLITNDKTTKTAKNISAQKLGIPIINEEEFNKICK